MRAISNLARASIIRLSVLTGHYDGIITAVNKVRRLKLRFSVAAYERNFREA